MLQFGKLLSDNCTGVVQFPSDSLLPQMQRVSPGLTWAASTVMTTLLEAAAFLALDTALEKIPSVKADEQTGESEGRSLHQSLTEMAFADAFTEGTRWLRHSFLTVSPSFSTS